MRKILVLILLVALFNIPLIVTTSLSTNEEGDDGLQDSPWPMFNHDVRHTGRSLYDTSRNIGGERWRCAIGSTYSSPAIDKDGVLYIGSDDYHLYAISPQGTVKWRFKTSSGISMITSSPAIGNDGVIYFGSWDNNLYAINLNGTLRWKFNAGGTVFSSPAIDNQGTIYFGILGPERDKGRIYALYSNGTEKWHYDTGFYVYSSPAIGEDGTIYIGSHDHYLYAINPNGTLKWRFKTGDAVKSSPSIDENGIIYVGSWDNKLYALYPNGTQKWSFRTEWATGSIDSSPSIGIDGTIYFGSYEGKLYAVNPDGTKKWSLMLTGSVSQPIYASPAIGGDGTIYVGGAGRNGKLYAVDPEGTLKWVLKIESDREYDGCSLVSSPAIGEDGTVYIGSWFYSEEGAWGYLHAIGGIKIEEPHKGYLYIAYREIGPTRSGETIIIGRTICKVSFFIEENVDKVEFYLDDQLIETVYETPFAIMLDETAFWKHTILAKAYYTDGSTPTDQMDVMIFNI